MWGQRLIRLVLLTGLVFLVVSLVKLIGQGSFGLPPAVNSLSLSRVTQGRFEFKKDSGVEPKQAEAVLGETNQETEPIAEPITNVQNQATTLIELVKNLPDDQVAAVKKQICKELCGSPE